MKKKVREWVKRYLPAEILSLIATLVAAWAMHHYTGNAVKTALAGTWGGNVVYFGYVILADVLSARREYKLMGYSYTFRDFLKNARSLFIEFGVAELVDTFVIRPFLMYYLPILLNNLSLGIIIAKVAADVTFYIPAIISYEINKKYFRKDK